MIRIEARNHEERWELLGIFENWQKSEIDACMAKNENYFLRAVKTGKKRKTVWTNF